MAKPGRPKTPTAVLRARGSWRGKTRQGEPQAGGEPSPPEWLSDDAQSIWDHVAPRLVSMGVAGEIDSGTVARYCTLFARWLECERFILSHGHVDGAKEFPQVGRASRLADQLLKLEQQYGMTASSRASMAIDTGRKPKEKDGISGFINPRLVG